MKKIIKNLNFLSENFEEELQKIEQKSNKDIQFMMNIKLDLKEKLKENFFQIWENFSKKETEYQFHKNFNNVKNSIIKGECSYSPWYNQQDAERLNYIDGKFIYCYISVGKNYEGHYVSPSFVSRSSAKYGIYDVYHDYEEILNTKEDIMNCYNNIMWQDHKLSEDARLHNLEEKLEEQFYENKNKLWDLVERLY